MDNALTVFNARTNDQLQRLQQRNDQLHHLSRSNRRDQSDAVGADSVGQDRLREVAAEFEAIFIKQMLSAMRETLQEENRLVDTGLSGDIFEDMLYDKYAEQMAKTSGFGLAEMIVQQFEGIGPSPATAAARYSGSGAN